MRTFLQKVGRLIFFAAWPAFYVYLNAGERTRIIVVCDGKVLATKNWISDNTWSLPGGGLHKNEPIVQGALRELLEETGVQTSPAQLRHVGHFMYKKYGLHFGYHAFVLQLTAVPKLKLQKHEISEVQWFTPGRLLAEPDVSADTAQALNAWLKL